MKSLFWGLKLYYLDASQTFELLKEESDVFYFLFPYKTFAGINNWGMPFIRFVCSCTNFMLFKVLKFPLM